MSPDAVALAPSQDVDDIMEKSTMILEAAGFHLVPLSHPLGPWQLLAVSPQGLLLLHICQGDDWPSTLGVLFGAPPFWPVSTRRLLHRWIAGEPWPAVLAL